MLHRILAATLMLLTPALASAATLPRNPFPSMDLARVFRDCSELGIRNNIVTLKRTGDTASFDEIEMQKISGPVGDGRYFLVVPFHNASLAEHSALVFATDGKTTYEVGGFSAKGDHFVVSYSDSIDITFYGRPSNGKTVPQGGPPPTSTSHVAVAGRHLAIAPRPAIVPGEIVARDQPKRLSP